jgi:SAM-dependent methyltransferase
MNQMTRSFSQRLSAHAHAALPHANPLSPAQMQAVSDAVVAWAPDSVLDMGCGPATLAIEIARARNAAHGLPLRGELRLMAAEFKVSQVPPQGAVICMGSSQVFGKPVEALSECVRLTKHPGLIVFADLVWTSPPPDEFLSFLGIDRGFYWLRSDAIPVFRQLGNYGLSPRKRGDQGKDKLDFVK